MYGPMKTLTFGSGNIGNLLLYVKAILTAQYFERIAHILKNCRIIKQINSCYFQMKNNIRYSLIKYARAFSFRENHGCKQNQHKK